MMKDIEMEKRTEIIGVIEILVDRVVAKDPNLDEFEKLMIAKLIGLPEDLIPKK